MAKLTTGTQIKLRNGSNCRIKKLLGAGGQGEVYLVDYNGKDYALKWYTIQYTDAFYENLERNIKNGSPSPAFLWPEALSERQPGSFGYLMKLRPAGYVEIGDFLLVKTRFANLQAILNACLQICTGFQQLHLRGLSYQDMNDGNFFINPQTGHVLICDNDNVAPNGINMGICGKGGYMAPEIVEREAMPNRYTDYFSLAIILFILFYMNRPFDGKRTLACPCLDAPNATRILFGKSCVFIMDPSDPSNAAVPGVHTNVLRRWPVTPEILRNTFIRTFSKEAILSPNKRVMDREWQQVLLQTRSQLIKCPICGKPSFMEPGKPFRCPDCRKETPNIHLLKVGNYQIPLVPDQPIYLSQVSITDDNEKIAGNVIRDPKAPANWGIRNESDRQWTVTTPNNETRLIEPGKGMPLIPGLRIRFSKETCGIID